ncbi:ribosomal protein L11 methyltransferase [Catalinimonas alkaloidigena]|uniref:50S ribosomal protein L11 methyltransferase n=1 Tax=Catalinimonas alkaloidigena TaxID=1075417 RepID=UPI00240604BF|nr:50S ribosomal protein L11 methyltransferase [Catalinimonas alkaloidigena]MDF9800621.1 ribosomal protein L11 methyltransferase [Catalinimonas alkaloidigena]
MEKKAYLSLQFQCNETLTEILIAELSDQGYDSFWEQDEGFEAYILEKEYDEHKLQGILDRYQALGTTTFNVSTVEEKNWNVEWESNFEQIVVEDKCLVRADFHKPEQNFPYEIVINPKMSFGTGHHATTYLMLSWQLEIDHKQKKVMDAGCGTGILAIMAHLKGADEIVAFDNNEWAVDNTRENFEINHCPEIKMFLGTVEEIDKKEKFDIILANINRNVLLDEMDLYATRLKDNGILLLSGFYHYDASQIEEKASASGLKVKGLKERNDWVALKLSF